MQRPHQSWLHLQGTISIHIHLINHHINYLITVMTSLDLTVRKNPAINYPVSTNPVDISPSEMNPAWFESRQDWIPSYLNPAKTQFRQTRIPLKVNPTKTESRLKWTPSWLDHVKRQSLQKMNLVYLATQVKGFILTYEPRRSWRPILYC